LNRTMTVAEPRGKQRGDVNRQMVDTVSLADTTLFSSLSDCSN
jgi:hypothetical protein